MVTDTRRETRSDSVPALRIGLTAGLTGILCCVGPTVLALLGVVSAGTAVATYVVLYAGTTWLGTLA